MIVKRGCKSVAPFYFLLNQKLNNSAFRAAKAFLFSQHAAHRHFRIR